MSPYLGIHFFILIVHYFYAAYPFSWSLTFHSFSQLSPLFWMGVFACVRCFFFVFGFLYFILLLRTQVFRQHFSEKKTLAISISLSQGSFTAKLFQYSLVLILFASRQTTTTTHWPTWKTEINSKTVTIVFPLHLGVFSFARQKTMAKREASGQMDDRIRHQRSRGQHHWYNFHSTPFYVNSR